MPIPYFAADLSAQPTPWDLLVFLAGLLTIAALGYLFGRIRADRELQAAQAVRDIWESHHTRALERAIKADQDSAWVQEQAAAEIERVTKDRDALAQRLTAGAQPLPAGPWDEAHRIQYQAVHEERDRLAAELMVAEHGRQYWMREALDRNDGEEPTTETRRLAAEVVRLTHEVEYRRSEYANVVMSSQAMRDQLTAERDALQKRIQAAMVFIWTDEYGDEHMGDDGVDALRGEA